MSLILLRVLLVSWVCEGPEISVEKAQRCLAVLRIFFWRFFFNSHIEDESGSKSTVEKFADPQYIVSCGAWAENFPATVSVTGKESEATSSTQSTTTPTGAETSTPTHSSEETSFKETTPLATLSADDDAIIAGSNTHNIDIQVFFP